MMLVLAIALYLYGGSIAWCGVVSLQRLCRRKRTRSLASSILGVARIPLGVGLGMIGEEVRRGFEGFTTDAMGMSGIAVVALCLTFAAALIYAGVRFDPANGRRRCPRCWYDMAGTPMRRCPECGHECSKERRLFRARRSRWLIAAGMMLALAPCSIGVAKDVNLRGWVAAIPTPVLIAGLPWLTDEMAVESEASLRERYGGGCYYSSSDNEMWRWQERLLRWRCRSLLRTSTDLRVVELAAIFNPWKDNEPRVTLTRETQFLNHPGLLLCNASSRQRGSSVFRQAFISLSSTGV